MGKRDPRIDAYIEKTADFAKPILKHVRELVHKADPEIEETLKWGMPHFVHEGIVFGIAAFKAHCAINFWKGSLVIPSASGSEEAMGNFGKITSLADLPKEKVFIGYVKEAVRLNEQGVKSPSRAKPAGKKEVEVPDYFAAALRKKKKAQAAFDKFSYSHRKEYVEWITEAKTEATRNKRIETALEWLAEGKSRNWKYMNCGKDK